MSKKIKKEYLPEKCLYCGESTSSRSFIINPKAKASKELPCCCEECYEKTMKFIKWDNKWRPILYTMLFLCVVVNLFFWGLNYEMRWQYVPLLLIALSVVCMPSVFTRYERYQALGILKTKKVIRGIAGLLAVFALFLLITYS